MNFRCATAATKRDCAKYNTNFRWRQLWVTTFFLINEKMYCKCEETLFHPGKNGQNFTDVEAKILLKYFFQTSALIADKSQLILSGKIFNLASWTDCVFLFSPSFLNQFHSTHLYCKWVFWLFIPEQRWTFQNPCARICCDVGFRSRVSELIKITIQRRFDNF